MYPRVDMTQEQKCLNQKYNEVFDESLKEKTLNFCAVLLPNREEKLSVVANYRPCAKDQGYVTLNESLEPICTNDLENFYYGVSPVVNEGKIARAISELAMTDEAGLERFISGYCDKFMLHMDQAKYLLDIAKYIVICSSLSYGIRIQMEKNEAEQIIQQVSDGAGFLSYEEKNGILRVKGCPTQEFLVLMKQYRFIQSKTIEFTWEITHGEGSSIWQIYENIENIRLLNGDVFYSGVLLRPTQISLSDSISTNKNVTSLEFHFERSTYATVLALDNNFLSHPLLKGSGKNISEFMRHDDACKRRLHSGLQECSGDSQTYRKRMLEVINTYLNETYNVNQIGVTGNIVTKDQYLLVGNRSSNAIDSNHLYPSVNGNAEIVDTDVDFYAKSVYEDYPEIRLNEERIHFMGELSREAYAELGLGLEEQRWHCIGITMSGNIPDAETGELYDKKYRRCHFNILCEQNCDEMYSDVVDRAKSSAESYENKEFYGIRVDYYKNKADFLGAKGKAFLEELLQAKDIIESVLILLLFLFSMKGLQAITLTDVQTIASLIFAGLVIVTTSINVLIRIVRYCKVKKYLKKITMFEDCDDEAVEQSVQKILKGHAYHPVTYVALKLHIGKMSV